MKRLINARWAANLLLSALGALALFHVLVMARVVPARVVWGGQLDVPKEGMIVLEVVALAVTLLFALIVAMKGDYITVPGLRGVAKVGMWVVFGYFVLNVVGNLASVSSVEMLIFTPVTILLAILALRLALE